MKKYTVGYKIPHKLTIKEKSSVLFQCIFINGSIELNSETS
jgi:hypothetical protein